jgi:UDP-N-acetylmuramate dehydrogenase
MQKPALIQQNIPLAPYTTLGVGGSAEFFAEVTTVEELQNVVRWAKECLHAITILGGGSNMLIRDGGIKGLVIRPRIGGITYEVLGKNQDEVCATVGAGVALDACIAECVQKGFWGLENLSAIPGTVGAIPVQNVGAYGVEAKDIVHSVTAYNMETDTFEQLSNSECNFGYRDSIFKHTYRSTHIITAVTLCVSHTPKRIISYKDLAVYFNEHAEPALQEIRNAVISIRSKKFPDLQVIGTAGSFFKNPIIPRTDFLALKEKYPELPGYEDIHGRVKIALGWVLEHVCNLKGFREGAIGLFEKQALVLVCEKGISADTVEAFSQQIIDIVFAKTGIVVEREVNVIGDCA